MSVFKTALFVFLLGVVACSEPRVPVGKVLDTGLVKIQSLDVYPDSGNLHILVAVKVADATVQTYYFYSDNSGQQWSIPVRVDAGMAPPHKPARNTDAQIVANGQHLIAAWQIAGSGWGGFGPIITAISEDGGNTWRPGANPADMDSGVEQGFIDLAGNSHGTFHAVWLDKRNEVRGLRYSRSANGGNAWNQNLTIDSRTCECCWNRIQSTGDSLFVSYRDASPRDMHVAVSHDNGVDWLPNVNAGEFDWQFEGCPHSGAGLAAGGIVTGNTLHLTTLTGKEKIAGLYYTRSEDVGISWRKPVLIGAVTAKHSDVAVNGERVIAVWDDSSRRNSTIFMAQSFNNGDHFRDPISLHCADQSAGSHPRIVTTGETLHILWTTAGGNLCTVNIR